MKLVPPNELLQLRTARQVHPETAIDQLIEYIIIQQAIIEMLDDKFYAFRTDVDRLMAHTGMKPMYTDPQMSAQ